MTASSIIARWLFVALAVLALGAGAAWAGYGSGQASYQTASLTFNAHRPAHPTGSRLKIDYVNPSDPQGKPPAVRRVVARLVKGASIDTSVPDQCTATDEELMATGEAACPEGSRVGKGVVTVDTGFPDPQRFVTADVNFFNAAGQLIYLNTIRGTQVRTVIRAAVEGRRVVTDAPTLPGTPPDGGAIDTVDVRFFRIVEGRGDGQRAYMATPRHCPPSGHWTNRLRFSYDGGVTQVVKSASRCEDSKR